MLQPAILVRDPDLIKDVLVTEFNKFRDNDFTLSKKQDPLIQVNTFFAKYEGWKESRKRFSPVFSPTKVKQITGFSWKKIEWLLLCVRSEFQLKAILPIMNKIGKQFSEFVKSYAPNTDFDAKDVSSIDFQHIEWTVGLNF